MSNIQIEIIPKTETMSTLKFDRNGALQYQLCLVRQLIVKQEELVQQQRCNHQHQVDMRMVLNESPIVWKSMSQVLKPSMSLENFEKDVEFQQQLLEFLRAKQRAIELTIAKVTEPKVSVNSSTNSNE